MIASHRDLAAAFLKKVWAYQSVGSDSRPTRLDVATRERLKSLGYLSD